MYLGYSLSEHHAYTSRSTAMETKKFKSKNLPIRTVRESAREGTVSRDKIRCAIERVASARKRMIPGVQTNPKAPTIKGMS